MSVFPKIADKIEVILIDDGSKDKTAEIVKKYKNVPGILMYALGNENNYGLEWKSFEIENLPKTERIDVRASAPVKQLLQEAAHACHKNVSEFLLDAGVTAATQTLADRRLFMLDEAQWQAFQEALDRPVQNKPRLKTLLREPGVLD